MNGIVNAITSMKAMNQGVAIGMSIMRKTLDVAESQGAQLVENMRAMELSVNPNLGSKFDMKI